ncbi:SWPV2-ORF217 [Shearwaterpox virus]|uniref:SWPV2-ORF217 n=1 Tax=Shearwaterpox virus TaxID=1974596 RepID=A0A1V0QGI8_CNPV|nr:SWPV2-ORF217 [Shearwaterpox virus]QRI42949.1 MyD116-like domain protein [Cheloniid poxvirus 1]QRM15510.1 MyD116-like domain protein [Mudlarkpox virus]QRM15863.1 myd116-like domain protein [Penguinpox virus 2]QRM16200.1 myd116-like domain protein [Albatrosspox virus]
MEIQEKADVKKDMFLVDDNGVENKELSKLSETDSFQEWDESDEDSSNDTDTENMELWNMFCRSDDPYNLFTFTASVNKEWNSTSCHIDITKKSVVTFSETIIEYHVPYEDRKGPWEEIARDRYRFEKRIKETAEMIEFCLSENHRRNIKTHLKYEDDK